MKQGRFYGHSNVSVKPTVANWAESLPYEPPVAWLPHQELRASPSQPLVVKTGIFAGDWLLGDVNNPGLVRISLDRVGTATPNGAVFWFSKGFKNAAINRMAYGPDGGIYIGTLTTIGNWPGGDKQDFYRLAPKSGSATAFEMKAVRSLKDGLEIEFTLPVNPATVQSAAFTVVQQEFQRKEQYGAGEQTKEPLTISETAVSSDGKRVYLKVAGLRMNRVVHLKHSATLKSGDGKAAWNDLAYFTLNNISTRAWSATVAVNPDSQRRNGILDRLVSHRSAGGLVAVDIRAEGPWKASLVSPNGTVVSATAGNGAASFHLSRGQARAGLHLLRVTGQGGEVVRMVML